LHPDLPAKTFTQSQQKKINYRQTDRDYKYRKKPLRKFVERKAKRPSRPKPHRREQQKYHHKTPDNEHLYSLDQPRIGSGGFFV
jgi:hypothetical protein